MLNLHIVQAEQGDCLILEYGAPSDPRYMLIDGGPDTIYEEHLRGVLQGIRDAGRKLDLVVLSHVDDDHVHGLLDLMAELQEQRDSGTPETVTSDELWHNTFSQTIGSDVETRFRMLVERGGATRQAMIRSDKTDRSIRQGDGLTQLARGVQIPINGEFAPHHLISTDQAPEPIELGNLSLRIVGPTKENLEKLRQEWLDWLEEHDQRMLVRDPMAAERAARKADDSVPNLSSIMILAEAGGKTILLTGDGRHDHLLEGLSQASLLSPEGNLHVDVLKVPHHGSKRNVTKKFFETVTADKYVISANGMHDNPDLDTLRWIVEAATEQERAIEILVTNATDSTRQLVDEYTPDEYGYRLTEMEPGDHSMTLKLEA